MTKKGLGDEIYSGAASFGKLRAVLGVIFGTIIGIGLIIGGIFAIAHKTKRTMKTTGTSVDLKNNPVPIQCTSASDKDGNTYQCNFTLKYTVKKDQYSHSFQTNSSTDYNNMTQVTVYYNPNTPGDVSLTKDDYHTVGYVLIGFGVFILIGAWISLWIVLHYKFAAAASGAAGAIEMVRAI
jgi:hypothetical protein